MSTPRDLLGYFETRLDATLALLGRLVALESPSHDKPAVDAMAAAVASEFALLGAEATVVEEAERGNHVRAVWHGPESRPPVLVLGHLDTVWPRGTLAARPFRIEKGIATGPGVFDMKSGIAVSLAACRALAEGRRTPGREVRFLFTSDEEIGSTAGLPHLRELAAGCRAVLCLEPSLPGGRVKTFRKGVGNFRLRVEGIAAHAGVDHAKGANAIAELARVILRLQALTDYARGITVNVGTVSAGTAANVVPALAEAEVDFRVATVGDGEELVRRVHALAPEDHRCRLRIEGGVNRPPLERTAAVVALFEEARRVAAELGMDLGEGSTGGGSDGSFTAAMGIPTLDGLGVEGDGAHAETEHAIVGDIPRRAALLCGLLAEL